MLTRTDDYDSLYRSFRWDLPSHYNMGVDVCDRHATGDRRLALIFIDETGAVERFSFDDIKRLSNQFANVLAADGLVPGDRVAVLLSQGPETAVAHVGAMKAGFISLPLFTLFGEQALEFRLHDSGAKAIVTDLGGAAKIAAIRERLPDLRHVYVIGTDTGGSGNRSFATALARASDRFTPVATLGEDPAVIVYTSGTTGNPKGALHAHRVLLGHLPSLEVYHDFMPQPGDLQWTPADWAWVGGLFDVLLPSWHFGIPVVAHRARKFDPEEAMRLMADHEVRNTFLPPTALKMLRLSGVTNARLNLRTLVTGGESLGTELLDWSRAILGVVPNEMYGQTECNIVAGGNTRIIPLRPGSIGKTMPGHEVRIVDDEGTPLPPDTVGNIGVRKGDPVMLLEYWRNPKATAAKYAGDFLITGDLGRMDEDGYLWYVSRADDVITSGGYRIGPGEIEDCLLGHPAIAMAGVVGIPDPVRTEAIKAWIVLKPGHDPSDTLAREIQNYVRTKLAAHEYPRHVAFVTELPMTTTGKIIRRELRARG